MATDDLPPAVARALGAARVELGRAEELASAADWEEISTVIAERVAARVERAPVSWPPSPRRAKQLAAALAVLVPAIAGVMEACR